MSRVSQTDLTEPASREPQISGRKRKLSISQRLPSQQQFAQPSCPSPAKRGRLEAQAPSEVDGTLASTKGANHKTTSLSNNGPVAGETGDFTNGLSSASSLTSTSSSVFSRCGQPGMAAHSGVLAQNHTLTPLTTSDSSPPGKTLSPKPTTIPGDLMSSSDVGVPNVASAASNNASDAITPIQTPPTLRLQPRPGPGEEKGAKLIWDPELDSQIPLKDKKRHKPKYKVFGTEVRLHALKV